MTDLVDVLLAGPRGRRLCLELAQGGDGDRKQSPEQETLWEVRFYAEAARSTTSVRYASFTAGDDEPDAGDDEPEWPVPTTEEVAAALDAVGPVPVDDLALMRALATSVDSARPWQDPDTIDLLLTETPMAGPLRRIAERIAAVDAAQWLTEPIADEQWLVDFEVTENLQPEPPFPSVPDALEEWRAERIDASGHWWVFPPWPIPMTSRARAELGPIGLWAVEDSFGWHAASVTRAAIPAGTRVYEVTDAEAWAALCRSYPLELADSSDEWGLCTGWEGRWILPDWSLVARDIDAVHLTGAAYLAAAETAIPVSGDRASTIAGWAPDHTYWLTAGPELHPGGTRWATPGEDGIAPHDVWSPA
jgi:hypothetical protein